MYSIWGTLSPSPRGHGSGQPVPAGDRGCAIDPELAAAREADQADVTGVRHIEAQIAMWPHEIRLAALAIAKHQQLGRAAEVATCKRAQRAACDGERGPVALEVKPRRAIALVLGQQARHRRDDL